MQKQDTKNKFQGLGFAIDDDSDDDLQVMKTKTAKKKEANKITENKPKQTFKVNAGKMAEGGFKVEEAGRPQTATRGGDRGGYRGGDRGAPRGGDRGRGGRGGRGRGDGPREPREPRLDAEGNPIKEREHKPFRGKPREEGHPYDRKSGAGRGRKPDDKKGGHGRFNDGDKPAYKPKNQEGGEGAEEVKEEKVREYKKPEPVPEPEMEQFAFSLDEIMATKTMLGRKEARGA